MIWGAPTPVTMRVVQIEPGPTPTLMASAPASTNAWAPSRVATLPPMTWTCRVAGSLLRRCDHLDEQAHVAVGRVGDEHVDAGLDEGRRTLPRVTEVADRRADHEAAVGVVARVGELLALDEVLDGDEAGEVALVVDDRQALALVLAQQRPSPRRG